MNRPVSLCLSVSEMSKIVLYEFRHDYVKLKYGEKGKICYTDTDSFTVYIKTKDIYVDTAKDNETRFYNSNYKLDRPLHNGNNKKLV